MANNEKQPVQQVANRTDSIKAEAGATLQDVSSC